jgi:hypothetical protein
MYGFDWNGVAAASAGVGIALAAVIAFKRRRTGCPRAPDAVAAASEPRRRIDVVAIDEGAARGPEQEKP